MRGRAVLLGSLALVGVLSALMVGVLAAIRGVDSRTAAVDTSVRTLSAYQGVQRSIANEAFAEAGYRRSPNPSSRGRLEAAIGDVAASVGRVRQLESAREDGTVNYLLILNGRYESQVRSALRDGGQAAATTLDDRVAGPALDAIQGLVDGAVSRQQRLADQALDQQAALTGRLVLLGPTALGAGILAVALCWVVIVRQHRQVRIRADASEHRARHDVLTGVGNRSLLSDEIADELAQPVPDAALLMLDLDRFKGINDDHGHSAGDEVLRTVASRLLKLAGTRDVVCRMGGDEFAVLVRPATEAPQRALLIERALSEPVRYGTAVLQTGGSVGHALLRPGRDEPALLREADEGLYASKRAQRLPSPRTTAEIPDLCVPRCPTGCQR